jgi:Zn-dependent M28 family amino/carboxypeptidase
MVGAHLDSVDNGPGIQDNGTGSAVVLELAAQAVATGMEPAGRLRFALWGAEEAGLVGSEAWVASQDGPALAELAGYVNLDMIGSPNGIPAVYDSDASDLGTPGPPGSELIEAALWAALEAQGVPPVPTELNNRSDYGPFAEAGVPVGGLFTGAEQRKTAEEAKRYGGDADMPYDPCYHRECDDIENIDFVLLEQMMIAAAGALDTLAAGAP